MSKEKAIKYIKAACVAIDEEPYPCTTKAKLLLVEALKELETIEKLIEKAREFEKKN